MNKLDLFIKYGFRTAIGGLLGVAIFFGACILMPPLMVEIFDIFIGG